MSTENFSKRLLKRAKKDLLILVKFLFKKGSRKRAVSMAFSIALATTLVISSVMWGVSKADTFPLGFLSQEDKPDQNFSASGIVSSVSTVFGTYMYIDQASASDNTGKTTFGFSVDKVNKIETVDYTPLTISDIKVGDQIIVQGLIKSSGTIEAYRIISFATSTATSTEDATSTASTTATSTSTTTDDITLINIASSTDQTASGSEDNGTTSLSGGSGGSGGVIQNIIDTISQKVKDVVLDVVNIITDGLTNTSEITSTSTQQDVSSSTPPKTSDNPVATTTSDVYTTPIIDQAPASAPVSSTSDVNPVSLTSTNEADNSVPVTVPDSSSSQ